MSGDSEPPSTASPPPSRLQSWPEAWAQAMGRLVSTTAERRAIVITDIVEGSKPTAVYYVLLGISELIAGFALIIDSDATLIGANVVAPLMLPIFGVSLGLMRGDLRLLRTALIAEFGGALFGVALTYLLGLMPLMLEPSAALLAQTRPTLIDLFVAALAGFAGGLAMIDERISPALPGVAIATALNPPIAAIGLCLAFGSYTGAWGAFLLFFANFLAILAVAAVIFVVAGLVTRADVGSLRGLARRFAAAAIGLVLVTGLLTSYLVGMVRELRTNRTINAVLDQELAHEPGTALANVEFSRGATGLDILSTVRTPRVIEPARVKQIQDALSQRLAEPVQLFMRCALTKDVTATGSTSLRPYLSLHNKAADAPLSEETRLLLQAEQVAREVVASRPAIVLKDVELIQVPTGPVLIFSIESPRDPLPGGVERFEALLRERLHEPSVRVVVRVAASTDITSKGRILFGAAHFDAVPTDEAASARAVEAAVRAGIQRVPDMFVTAADAVPQPPGWAVRAEVVGPRALTPAEVHTAEDLATKSAGVPVQLSVLPRSELVVTGTRYEAMGATRSTPAAGDKPAGPTPAQPEAGASKQR